MHEEFFLIEPDAIGNVCSISEMSEKLFLTFYAVIVVWDF